MVETVDDQRGRVERAVRELIPHGRVEFDPTEHQVMRFRILDRNTNSVLAANGVLHARELNSKSDDWLRQYICQLGGGDI